MKETRRFLRFAGLLLGFALLAASALAAADPKLDNSRWENLKTLAPGAEVRVVLNDAKSFRGQFQGVSEDVLVLRLAGSDQTFARRDILRVSTRGKSRRGRNALIGLGVGFAIGAISSAIELNVNHGSCAGTCYDAGTIIGSGVGGAALGAGIGALVHTGGWHDVYRAS